MENVLFKHIFKNVFRSALDFVSLEFGVNLNRAGVGAHSLPPEALEDRGVSLALGTGCPGAMTSC